MNRINPCELPPLKRMPQISKNRIFEINMTNFEIEESLMRSLIKSSELLLPFKGCICLDKIESPDYCLCDRFLKIGIEITRAMDENLSKAYSERDKLNKKI